MIEETSPGVEDLAELCRHGQHWQALASLGSGNDLLSMGYQRVLEVRIVADLLADSAVNDRVPKITDRFLRDFVSFDLTGAEGYLASLIDGHLPLGKILLISTLGRFTTLLALARLREKGVLSLES